MNTNETVELLSQLPLFRNCNKKTLAAACEKHAEHVFLSSDESLGENCAKKLGILLSGTAEICSADQGKSVILRTLRPGDVFGAAGLFCQSETALSRVTATNSAHFLLFSAETVRSLLSRDQGFLDAYLAFLAGRVAFLNRKILCFTAGSAERRLALWLVSEEGDVINLPSSLSALSEMLDIGRASLYRALDKLENESLIARQGREITVLDREAILKKYQ